VRDRTDSALRRPHRQPNMPNRSPATLTCPHCQTGLVRVPRSFGDRLISLFVPMQRWRCAAVDCGWEALVRRGTPVKAASTMKASYLPQQWLESSRGFCDDSAPPRKGTN
jgi:hypothetical protein